MKRAICSWDVGKRQSAWAFFYDGELEAASHGHFDDLVEGAPFYAGCLVLIEFPNKEKHRAEIPLSDLLHLARRCGRIEQRYIDQGQKEIQLVLPVEWKGSVDKKVMNNRVLKRLTEDEKRKLPRRPRAGDYDHNLLDAVGIGLWKLGRLR